MGQQPDLFSAQPSERLQAAQAAQAGDRRARRTRKGLEGRVREWPPYSPGAINAWLLMVTTKAPEWSDRFLPWREAPLTVGRPHEGFFYPDPIGFWTEVRKWAVELIHHVEPEFDIAEALSVTTLLHMDDDVRRFQDAVEMSEPRLVLFLDEASWEQSGLEVRRNAHHIADPHRQGKVYEGFWGRTADGIVVGKSPQHPTMHNLYRTKDMVAFLRSAPLAPNT